MLNPLVTRLRPAAAWALAAAIAIVTLAPRNFRPHLGDAQVERFGGFFLAGLAFAIAYPTRLRFVALGVVMAAVSLELLQLIASGRDAGVPDAVAKCLGGLTAVGLVGTVRATLNRKRRGG